MSEVNNTNYVPTEWQTGDIVTSEKLNKIEQGVARAGVLVCNMVVDEDNGAYRLDHTWQEIADAGFAVAIVSNNAGQFQAYPLWEYGESEGTKYCVFGDFANAPTFSCENASDYPVLDTDIGGGNGGQQV